MRLGVLLASYNNAKFLDDCLNPWVKLKNEFDIKIAITHAQFREYHELGYEDNDRETLYQLLHNKHDDFLYIQNHYWFSRPENYIYEDESGVRNHGLKWLLEQDIDYFLTLGNDEIYTEQEIRNTIDYIQKDPFIAVYNIEYKNLTFDDKTYIKGFMPQRIWRVYLGDYRLNSFTYDDDCDYISKLNNKILDKMLSHKKIPINLCNPLHFSWNDLERSKNKILYAEKRWNPPNGNGCSFKIDEGGQSISFNMDYYNRIQQNPPELFKLK